jgi:transposase
VPTPYPREFRDDAVRVVRNREPSVTIEQIAKDFGVHTMTLQKWLQRAAVDSGPAAHLEPAAHQRKFRCSQGVQMKRAVVMAVVVSGIIIALSGCAPAAGPIAVNGRTLLTHPSTGASADALGSGELGTNAEGCVTLGKSVLVVPEGSALDADGSITVLGKSYHAGSRIELGGGVGNAPVGAKCGPKSVYFWVG